MGGQQQLRPGFRGAVCQIRLEQSACQQGVQAAIDLVDHVDLFRDLGGQFQERGQQIDHPLRAVRLVTHLELGFRTIRLRMIGHQFLGHEFAIFAGHHEPFVDRLGQQANGHALLDVFLQLGLQWFGERHVLEREFLATQVRDAGVELRQHLVHGRIERLPLVEELLERFKTRIRRDQFERVLEPVVHRSESIDLLGDRVGQEQLVVPCPLESELEKLVPGQGIVEVGLTVPTVVEHLFAAGSDDHQLLFQDRLAGRREAELVDDLVDQQLEA